MYKTTIVVWGGGGGDAILGIHYRGGGLAIQVCLVFNLYLSITITKLQDTSSVVLMLLMYSL